MSYVSGLVSVIIPTYKRSDMLLRSINSVIDQTYDKIEVFVVNDNTPGDEYSIALYRMMNTITDQRVHLVEQEKHINGAAARNAGIREAKGEYIAFLDDDDYWDKNKIEFQVKDLSGLGDEWGAVVCLKRIYNDGELIRASMPFMDGDVGLKVLEGMISLGTGAVLMRRAALDNSGYFDESLKRHQDVQLFARLTDKYKIKVEKVYLHNREVKDNQNRPLAQDILRIKEAYFNSVNDLIRSYPEKVQKSIYAVHNFEAAYCFLKEKKISQACKLMFAVVKSPKAVYASCYKVIDHVASSVLKKVYIKNILYK